MVKATLKRAPTNLLMDVIVSFIFGLPGLVMTSYNSEDWIFKVGLVYVMIWAGISFYVFKVLYEPLIIMTETGISTENKVYSWSEIKQFKTKTEIEDVTNENGTGTYKQSFNYLIIVLYNDEQLKFNIGNLNYSPEQIMELYSELIEQS